MVRVPPEKLDQLGTVLLERGGRSLETKNPHEAFRIEVGRWPVTAYTSGKLTFNEPQLEEVLAELLGEVLDPVEGPVVGSDEAGKGEWLGPLVAAACAVAPGDRAWLVARGVMDSKEVSAGALDRVAGAVEQRCPHQAVVLVSPERFNDLWPRFKREGKGLNELLAWAHAKALGQVLGSLEDAGAAAGARVLVDQFARVATEARTQRAFDVDRYPVEQRVRAEDEVAVAAASVLAKAARDRWIDAFERREGVPVRSLDREAAREHARAGAFAKVGYL